MKKEDANYVLSKIYNEGFHYCFESYSSFEEIGDFEFHRLRTDYLKAVSKLQTYLDNESSRHCNN